MQRAAERASEDGGPDTIRPPKNLKDFDSRSELLLFDENNQRVKFAYGMVVWK